MKLLLLLFVATLLFAAAAPAEPASPATVPRERDVAPNGGSRPAAADNRATEWVKRQLELTFQLQEQVRKNEGMWMDSRFATPEIDGLRQRYRRLAVEMSEVQAELRQLVAALPEAQAEQAKVERLKTEYQELARQIEARKKDKGLSAP